MTTDHLAKHSCGFRVEDWDTPPDATLCDGCGCDAQPFGNLLEIGECSLTVGAPSPAGRCPDCEGLCYVIEPDKPPIRLYVIMDGGLVQDVVSPDDSAGVEVWVIDYDTEGADRDELSDVTFDSTSEAVAYPVTINPCTAPTIADLEDEEDQ